MDETKNKNETKGDLKKEIRKVCERMKEQRTKGERERIEPGKGENKDRLT